MEISFSNESFANLIFLPAKVNGAETNCLFDTGASISIMSASFARAIGANGGEIYRGGNNNGKLFSMESAVCTVEVGGATRSLTVGILPDAAFALGTNDNPFPARFFLGWDFISKHRWVIDTNARTTRIMKGGTAPKQDNLIWDGFPQLPILFNGKPLVMGLDTGHTDTMLDYSWKERIPNAARQVTEIVGVGGSATETTCLAHAFTFDLGGVTRTLENVEIFNHPIPGGKGKMCGLFGIDLVYGTTFELDFLSRYFAIEK